MRVERMARARAAHVVFLPVTLGFLEFKIKIIIIINNQVFSLRKVNI